MKVRETRVKAGGRQGGGHGDDERGVKSARDIDLQRSVEILGELGLSKENIVAYQRRFPIPTPTSGDGTDRRRR